MMRKDREIQKSLMESKAATMKPGFYELHILIESTSGLSLLRDTDIDAMISVTTFGKTEYTKVKKGVGFEQVVWGEHFYFNKYFAEEDYANEGVIIIEAWDHKRVLRNSLIGSYELNLQRVYSVANHTVDHLWLALSDSATNFGEIVGYIKISISIAGENDKGATLAMEPLASINSEKKVLMPPQIERKSYQLTIEIYQGKYLRPADGETVDPYVGVQFGQIFQKTETIIKNRSPEWNQRISVPVHLPAIIDNIILRIIDVNIIQDKQVLGSYYLNINRLINESNSKNREALQNITSLQWVNVYGPQNDSDNKEAKRTYQLYPDSAPYYVGSLLIKAFMEKKSAPVSKVEKIGQPPALKPLLFYQVTADIQMAINVPTGFKQFKIGIKIGEEQIVTKDWSVTYNGFCLWLIQKKFVVSFYENQPLPDTFIYLINNKNVKMCFIRKPSVIGTVYENKWRSFKPDLSVNKLHKEDAGYIKMGLTIGRAERKEKTTETMLLKYTNFTKNFDACRVIVDLICAQSLLPGDDDGSADPFFTFNYQGSEANSTTKSSILNPVYFQRFILEGRISKEGEMAPLIVKVYDQDALSRQLIGCSYIDVENGIRHKTLQLATTNLACDTPVWYDLFFQNIKHGRFLANITVLKNVNIAPPKQINLRMKKYQVNLFILGLRGLKSSGIVSIRKPIIEFNVDALLLMDKETNQNSFSKNIRTEPEESGNSINVKVATKSIINLPENVKFWPTLSGKVKNSVIASMYEPLLGYFSINLQDAFVRSQKLKKEYEKRQPSTRLSKVINRKKSRLSEINEEIILSLRGFIVKNINYNWSTLQPGLQLNQIRDSNRKLNQDYVVVLPNYLQDKNKHFKEQYREIIDKNGEYVEVGYDKRENLMNHLKNERKRHYRYCLDSTYEEYYEKVNGSKLGIYDEIAIRRGRIIVPGSDDDNFLTKVMNEQDFQAGIYKGNCYITEFKAKDDATETQFDKMATAQLRNFMKETKIKMFLYVISATDLPEKDIGSKSDPFIIVNIGNEEIDFKKDRLQDEGEPQFNVKLVKDLIFPQNSEIEIQVWDYDPIGRNQLIGSTTIDAENRVFSNFGQFQFNNPIETHSLKVKQTKVSQGRIRFWVDFVPYDQLRLYREMDLSNNAPVDYEVRIIVWGCSQISSSDQDFTQMNDLFVACTFNGETQQTDVHYRTQSGEGSFNWRMLFPIKMPLKDTTVSFKVYDKNIVERNQYLASGTFCINKHLRQAHENEASVKLYLGQEDYSKSTDLPCKPERVNEDEVKYDIFDVELKNRPKLSEEEQHVSSRVLQVQTSGKVQISLQILTKKQAEAKKVGAGRDAPNAFPKVPEPTGRLEWSWNPLVMLSRLVGKGLKGKVLCLLIVIVIAILAWYFIPSFLGALLAKAV